MSYELYGENGEITGEISSLEVLEDGVILEHIKSPGSRCETFNDTECLYGTPETACESWEKQVGENSSDICCQKYAAEQLMETHFSEAEFSDTAQKNGWYYPESGTTLSDVGNVLEYLKLKVERDENISIRDLCMMLDNGEKVICLVNDSVLHCSELSQVPGFYPNHTVEVIGVDATNPEQIKILINDPKAPTAKTSVDSSAFFKAMGANNFCIGTTQW